MNKVAIIVQRYHEDVVGGSESLAWHYATLLRDAYDVDLLTTTAVDISDWANVLPEGSIKKDGVNIVRFPVTVGRGAYWGELHQRLQAGFSRFKPGRIRDPDNPLQLQWSIPLQEEFILNQGPYSEPLMQFIETHWSDYRSLIFVTYLYPTTYFGLQRVPPGHALVAPTLHCEQTAYLSAYRHAAHRARESLWLTDAEQRVSQNLWGLLPGRIVSMGIDTKRRQPPAASTRYLLYCGRVDPNKGFPELFEYFKKYNRTFPGKLRLVITGKDDMKVPDHPDIEFRGFVSNEEKFSLMAGATIYISPSPNESLSIVTLEAMAQGTPILANGSSEVLIDHITRSGAGRIYVDYESFAASLSEMLSENGDLSRMGSAGREYVLARYQASHIRQALIEAIEFPYRLSSAEDFHLQFARNLEACDWEPHPLFSVFTQYDQEYYLGLRDAFTHKYRCFYALSKTIAPRSIIELGTSAGSSADAYLSAAPKAKYIGIDVFAEAPRHDDQSPWQPYEIAKQLFTIRGFEQWQLTRSNLRQLERLPSNADLVVVDAAHDFDNEYADLQLALTANPTFIFVDDADDENCAKPAIDKFVHENLRDRVEYTHHIPYIDGGLVIKLKK
jgi:glycosyltransferase involved in cell wall biosynthesis/predicted O-methyltransferase YrrM